jgi:hypothetical protein
LPRVSATRHGATLIKGKGLVMFDSVWSPAALVGVHVAGADQLGIDS